ncbi:DUF1461 domain-containing protein [uncultured Arthrobacter sp.]|uniref:lipoprotein intramolecular transacylase Lit n=1 Tax=uncultured Arthrobacter sp. TaxID=114050 RepID=UPI00345C4BAB
MADKAENENQGAPAGGERRAALRSDETGGGSTRVRESNFPMRKASTLPDVSAYSAIDDSDTPAEPGRLGTDDSRTSAETVSAEIKPDESKFPAIEQGETESGKTEPGKTEQGETESGKTEPGKTEQGETEPDKAEFDETAPGKTEQGETEPVEAEFGETEPGKAEFGETEPSEPGPGKTEQGETEPGEPGPGKTEFSNASPAETRDQVASKEAGEDYSPADHTTADPASLATQQIAATPTGAAGSPTGSTATPTGSTATSTGSTQARSTGSDSVHGSTTAAHPVQPRSNRRADDDASPDTSTLTIRPPEDDVNRRATQRDAAAAAKPLLPRILQVLVAVFFPVILLAAAVRAVTTPLFLWAEYHRPGFPADSYGFSTEDRMTYGSYAMDYILNWAPARFLGDLVNTDGDQLFLDSEVGHMADVKGVLSTGFVVATVLALLAIAACVYLARRYPGGIRRALFAGAVATLVLAIALAVAGVLAWETFFTQVHALFFADGTWTFRLDDTLIRLFPAQFWIDAAATVGAIVLIGAVLTLFFTWPTKARREKSAHAYAARRANSGI